MDKIWFIAANTYRESVREKILYNILFIALGLVFFSMFLGDWSIFDRDRMMISLSLSIISLSGLAVAVFLGVGLPR